jgi:hypothetical protein
MVMLAAAGLLLPAACRGRDEAGATDRQAGTTDVVLRAAQVEVPSSGDAVPEDDAGVFPDSSDASPSGIPDAATEGPDGVPGEPVVPPENREADARPGPASAEALGRKLLEAIVADDASVASAVMFPPAPFEMLKDLPVPSAYHRRLVGWFEEDLHTKHGELGGARDLVFERFRFGRCTWQEPHSEGNVLPYWSCRRNRIVALRGTRIVEIEVRVIINWGAEWFVVHLGPVRQ